MGASPHASGMGLWLPREPSGRLVLGTRAPLNQVSPPNEIWVLDFVSDVLENGSAIQGLQRRGPAHPPGARRRGRYLVPGGRVARALDRILAEPGLHAFILSP